MKGLRGVLSRLSIRSQVMAALLAVGLVMTLQFVVLFASIAGALDRQGRQATSRVADIWAEAVSGRLDNLERIEKYFGYQSDTLAYLSGQAALETFETGLLLDRNVELTKSVVPGLLDVVLYRGSEAQAYRRSAIPARQEILDRFVAQGESGSRVFYSRLESMEVNRIPSRVILAGMRVFATDPSQFSRTPVGTVVFLLDAATLVHLNLPGAGDWKSQFVGADGALFEVQGSQAIADQGEGETRTFERLRGTLTVWPNAEAVRGPLRVTFSTHMLVFLGLTTLAVILIRFVLAGILSSIRVLEGFSHRVGVKGTSELEEPLVLTGYSEAVHLADTLNTLLARIQKGNRDLLEAQASMYRLELRNHQAENKLLLSQINPHFFYNTLETIHGLASYHKVAPIQAISRSMESILRFTLREGDFVRLDREIAVVEAYLEIQKVRFGDRLESDLTLDPRFAGARIPKMILQPLVENAFIHGIEPLGRPGRLTVRAELLGPMTLVVSVIDNGVGLAPEKLARLRETLAADFLEEPGGSRQSIGLTNVHERLRLHYGSPFGLAIESAPGEGTTVRVSLPWTDAEEAGRG